MRNPIRVVFAEYVKANGPSTFINRYCDKTIDALHTKIVKMNDKVCGKPECQKQEGNASV
ncbi:hypothetical protein [Paenibacillus azoreducens]|uniref:Uncharacterized protein n=1 Tax=Paenibacillus azoreducens TaxID=116718 RepID=A0A919Y758_9BACL|nr:hypothetical protein [Paenibacillus azoreducens]GIO45376.1 hypothetical protein J34TS1_01410 [Paenibacillus azoreducens]